MLTLACLLMLLKILSGVPGRLALLRWAAIVLAAACGARHGRVEGAGVSPDLMAPAPSYWRQKVFFIPYQSQSPGGLADGAAKVELLAAHAGAGDWTVLQSAAPTVRGFSFHAPADGTYDFAVRTVDARGKATPREIARPQLRVVVDTQQPTLKLTATSDPAGRVTVRYEANDKNLRGDALQLEFQTAAQQWITATLPPADVRQSDRLVGQWTSEPLGNVRELLVRATILDQAGNRIAAAARASLFGQPAGAPAGQDDPRGSAITAMPSPSTLRDPFAAAQSAATAGPQLSDPSRTRANFVSDGGEAPPLITGPSLFASDNDAEKPVPAPFSSSRTEETSTTDSTIRSNGSQIDPGWDNPPREQSAERAMRWVNALSFEVDYDLQTVGPWGVAKVEMWATRDGGATWNSLGVDPDNRAPMQVSVPAAGVYGFRIVVDGANGVAAARPQPNEKPDLVVGVDLEAPQAALLGAKVGEGPLADHLLIRWSASDEHLDERPIGLAYATKSNGPWTTIATNLPNNGQYAWQLLPTTPDSVFLRLEVRDQAGGVTVRQSPAAVKLALPAPTGRIRSIRPVAPPASPTLPSQDRTARNTPSPR